MIKDSLHLRHRKKNKALKHIVPRHTQQVKQIIKRKVFGNLVTNELRGKKK